MSKYLTEICHLLLITVPKNKATYYLFLCTWLYSTGLQCWKQKRLSATPFCQPVPNVMPASAVKVKSCFGKTYFCSLGETCK